MGKYFYKVLYEEVTSMFMSKKYECMDIGGSLEVVQSHLF